MRAVIYARYSSDLQREASIEDQVEVCRRYAEAQGWTLVGDYRDAAISGASRFRPGFQKLLADAALDRFDVVICEAIDRLGRRLADTADLQDQLVFHRIRLHTPSLGEITPIHVAVMGMMAQLGLKDLAEKTRRGQLGRVLKGRIPAGLAYGYRSLGSGEDDGGRREVVPAEAAIVRRIFEEYAHGKAPEAIARDLNREGIPGPGGRPWSNTTIRGQADRGTGILNNALYRGDLVWNRCSYVKSPKTGRRVARPNPPEAWERVAVPDLRIVEDDLWERAKARQQAIRAAMPAQHRAGEVNDAVNPLNGTKRARFLLSGLLRCGICGGPYAIVATDRFGCSTRKRMGTCDNAITITRQEIENRVLVGLKERLLAPELVEAFVTGFQEAARAEHDRRRKAYQDQARQRADLDRRADAILKAIEDGFYQPAMKERMAAIDAERAALTAQADAPEDVDLGILLHPRLGELYRRRVERLEQVLEGPDRHAALELIRSMITRVDLKPRAVGAGLEAILVGDLASILSVCREASGEKGGADNAKRPSDGSDGRLLSVVAGAGFEPTTFRL